MPGNFENLQSLIDLAKEPSSERRRELLRQVTDLFVDAPEEYSEREVGQFGAIMDRLAFDLEMKVRQHLAERLSTVDAAPSDLVAKLANDAIEVARPLLTKSGALSNADLLEIVKNQSQEHLLAISQRKEVSVEVADGLVARGNDDVLVSLAGNDGAALSRSAMEVMVARAENNEALHQPLATRKGMPPDLMQEMFWFVSAALRQHILAATDKIDAKALDQMLAEAGASAAKDVQEQETRLSKAEEFVLMMEQRKQLTQGAVVSLLRQGKVQECVAGLARLADVDVRTAKRILFDTGGEAMAILCKANGFERSTFSNLMLLTKKEGTHKAGEKFELLDMYDKLAPEAAQRAMRFWRARRQVQRQVAAPGAAATAAKT